MKGEIKLAVGDKLVNTDHSKAMYKILDGKIGDLKSAVANRFPDGLEASTGIKIASFIPGRYSTPDVGGASEKVDVDGWVCAMLPATKDDYVEFDGEGSSSTSRLYAILDASKNVLFRSAANTSGKKTPTMSNYSDAAYIVVNSKTTYAGKTYLFVGDTINSRLSAKQETLTFDDAPTSESTNPVTSGGVYEAIGAVFGELSNVTNARKKKVSLLDGIEYTANHYWNTEAGIGGTAVGAEASGYYQYDAISVAPGDVVYIKLYSANSNKTHAVVITDSSYNILEADAGTKSSVSEFAKTMPENAAYLLLTTQSVQKAIDIVCEKIVTDDMDDVIKNNSYKNCKLSLLGDSFSAMNGYATNNKKYYPNENSDVQYVEQMWWKIVANELEMTPLVIGGWSGSPVAAGIRENTITPASDPSRCEALDDGTNDPDVILIAMGVNDYSYASEAAQFGTWDGTTALGSESDLSDYADTDFKSAYATMLARIQHKYPDAFIVCITPWFMTRKSTDTGANYLNAIGKSINDYADAVREICGIMHVQCINGTDIGFNRYNYYPTYAKDSSTTPTHPTIAGQRHIARAIIDQLKTLRPLGK